MDDRISRAAAIEAAVRLTTFKSEDELDKFVEDKACGDYYLGGICNVIDKIKELPAVDAIPIEWLRDKYKTEPEMLMRDAVADVMWLWKKEQEER